MKMIVAVLIVLVTGLTAAVAWLAWPKPVTAAEFAKATGAKYWLYRVPDSYKANQTIGVEVATSVSDPHSRSGGSGLRPGQLVKVFLIPSEDGSTYRWSILADSAVITSSVPNPFAGRTSAGVSYPPIGSILQDNVLIRGIESSANTNPAIIRIAISN
jgi:hypothetical protein